MPLLLFAVQLPKKFHNLFSRNKDAIRQTSFK